MDEGAKKRDALHQHGEPVDALAHIDIAQGRGAPSRLKKSIIYKGSAAVGGLCRRFQDPTFVRFAELPPIPLIWRQPRDREKG